MPNPQIRLGLFALLVPPNLWYPGYHEQRAGWEVQYSLNSMLGKIAKMSGSHCSATPHDYKQRESGYDIMLQNFGLALTTCLQFSPCEEQRKVAMEFFHVQTAVSLYKSPVNNQLHRRCSKPKKHRGKRRLL